MVEDVGASLDLVGTYEIADRLGIAYVETIHNWRRRYPDFPQPAARLRAGYVWLWPDVERWADRRGKPVGRRQSKGDRYQ